MGNKIFGIVVFALWGASMSWLMAAKILPPFFRGEPPRAAPTVRLEPVAWRIDLNGLDCGVSVSQAVPVAVGTTEVHSRVRMNRLPFPQFGSQWVWMQGLLKNLDDLRIDLRTKSTFDTLGQFASFETRLQANESQPVARILGHVSDGMLRLNMRAGEYVHESEHPWSGRSLLGGELSPQPRLLPVYVGMRWREEVYSPFSTPGSGADLIEAEVVEEEKLKHNGELVRTKRIEFRSLSAAGVSAEDRRRATVWVRDDGRVIRQDIFFMNTRLRFTRLGKERSQELADSVLELHLHAAALSPVEVDGGQPETKPSL